MNGSAVQNWVGARESLACDVLRWLATNQIIALGILIGAAGLFVLGLIALGRRMGLKSPGIATTSPWLVASWCLCLLVYLGGRLADALFSTKGLQYPGLSAEDIARAGWVELKLLGDTSLWPLVPLERRLPVAFLLHAFLWASALLVLYALLTYFTGSVGCKVGEIPERCRGLYRLTGCSTDRGLDASVRAWLVRFSVLLSVAMVVCLSSYAGVHQNTLRLAVGVCFADREAAPPGIAPGSPGPTSPQAPQPSPPPASPQATSLDTPPSSASPQAISLDAPPPPASPQATSLDVPPPPASPPGPPPGLSPGLVVLFLLLLPVIWVHAIPPAPWLPAEEKKKEPPKEAPEPVEPIAALRASLAKVSNGGGIGDDLETVPGVSALYGAWPEGTGSLLGRMLSDVVVPVGESPYRTQGEVVALTRQALSLSPLAPKGAPQFQPAPGAAPPGNRAGAASPDARKAARPQFPRGPALPQTSATSLEAENGSSAADGPERTSLAGAPRGASELDLGKTALVLTGPDGSGRLATLFATAVATYHERGGTTVLLCRDRARVHAVAQRFRLAVQNSAARWSVLLTEGADGLRNALVAARVPALVVVELHALEQIVLVEGAGARLLLALDAVLVDQIDEFVGVREMHLSLVLRRLWLALEGIERRPEPPLVLATAASSRGELGTWASQLLGRRSAVLASSDRAQKDRILVRRRQLLGTEGRELGVLDVAWACEAAGLPWHLRMSGPGRRRVQRVEGELAGLSRMRVARPAEAAVVILEGAFGEVENERLVTSLVATATPYVHGVHVAVPPVEDEHSLQPIRASLPWVAAPLEPPTVLRELHLSRALAHDELGRSGVLDVLLGREGQKLLDAWQSDGRLSVRRRRVLGPAAYQPEEEWRISRAAGAPALAELDVQCATLDKTRLLQEETGETLERVDGELAGIRYYPGAVLLLEQGRFQVPPNQGRRQLQDGYAARLLESRLRSVPERRWTAHGPLWQLGSTDRAMGSVPLRCRAGELDVTQTIVSVRSYAPDGAPLERRALSPPLETTLSTRAVLLTSGVPSNSNPAWLRPVAAVLTLLAPSVLRTARELLHIGVVEASGSLHLAFLDRTPGGNGVAALVDESLLVGLLRATLMVLKTLPPPLHDRLCQRFDEHPGAAPGTWDVAGAIAWLESVVTTPSPGDATQGPATASGTDHPAADPTLLARLHACFPPLQHYPSEEAALFCEWVTTALTEIPIRLRYGANPTDEDRLAVMAGLAAVFYRRPDLAFPKGFYVAIEPGRECHNMPGSSGYCQCFDDWHITLGLESLRLSATLDGYALVAHEAAHLMDALDGTGDGLIPGMTGRQKAEWIKAAAAEIPRAATGDSLLRTYAATNPAELLAEAVAAFVELPGELKQRVPALYSGLVAALRQDPVAWIARQDRERERAG